METGRNVLKTGLRRDAMGGLRRCWRGKQRGSGV